MSPRTDSPGAGFALTLIVALTQHDEIDRGLRRDAGAYELRAALSRERCCLPIRELGSPAGWEEVAMAEAPDGVSSSPRAGE
jgi:hypothetical protein